ncbi:YcjX family protein [Alteromonas aestuariivivens]|nr:YcjX family protein [Alteromonas aestuariivivens]
MAKGREPLSASLFKQRHRFSITGLSRSGKSMLFTSLMTMLRYRCEQQYNCLPLLHYLPPEQVESMHVEPLQGYTMFPIEEHLEALAHQRWPAPTEQLYGFKLVVRLRQTKGIRSWVFSHSTVVFEFVDYPGEWVTDFPMLSKSFTQWSDSAWAQQLSEPQLGFAQQWHDFVRGFDFEQAPSNELISELVAAYRKYLVSAKQAGISMLQPGSLLLESSGFDWQQSGFTPLPAKVSSDPSNPWTEIFQRHYQAFLKDWLQPLKSNSFQASDKQIILVDLFAGLNHSKQHLYQLKETLSHLADTFVYGNPGWFSKNILRRNAQGRVAFVGTKMDLLPPSQRQNMLSLLEQVTEGARAHFTGKNVNFEHFLVSAIQATDPGATDECLRYMNSSRQYMEACFEPIPARLEAMANDEHFPVLEAQVPDDFLPRILNGRGLDRLFQFLLSQETSNGR